MHQKSVVSLIFACLFLFAVSASTKSAAEVSDENIVTENDVWAFADIHGAYDEFVKLLKTAKLIDDNLNWSGGKAHLVSTGDVLDRGPHPRKVLDLMIKIEKQAKQAGGAFHFVLGNHEVMILTGDLRYVSDAEYLEFANDESLEMRERYFKLYSKYYQALGSRKNKAAGEGKITKEQLRKQFETEHKAGFFARYEAFLPQGKYGKWLLQKPLIQKVNGDVFTHAGLSPVLINNSFAALREQLRQTLHNYVRDWTALVSSGNLPIASLFKQRVGLLKGLSADRVELFKRHYDALLFSSRSPTWYRGDAYCHPFYENQTLTKLLDHFDANRLFVGHTPTNSHQVEKRLNNRVYLMDTGMLNQHYGGHGNILKIKQDSVMVFDTLGKSYPGIKGIHRPSFYPEKISMTNLESALKSSPISKMEVLNTGVTNPLRLTFSGEHAKLRAIFKYFDSDPGLEKKTKRQQRTQDFADRYHFEIAAYRLSELLGFNMVPLATKRKVKTYKGAAQYWVEGSFSEYTAEKEGWEYRGYCSYDEQVNLMRIFDLLIYNKDRNKTNVLIEQNYDQLVWIDHSRAFSSHKSLPKDIDITNLTLTPEVRHALTALNKDNLKPIMKGLLNRSQIGAILTRRDKILKLFD